MNEETGSLTVLLVGAVLVRLTVSGTFTRYVRPEMGVWLLIAGILLCAAGAFGVILALMRPQKTADAHHHHVHGGHIERVGWLLLAPIVVLLMVSPPALGSYGADRSTGVTISAGGRTFDPLPSDGVVTMTLLEFDQRAADNGGASFGTTPIQLTGFIARTDDGGGFRLARYQIACCAADAVAAIVRVVGVNGSPPLDSWVTVTGTYQRSGDQIPELVATSLQQVTAPEDPYET